MDREIFEELKKRIEGKDLPEYKKKAIIDKYESFIKDYDLPEERFRVIPIDDEDI